MLPREASLPVRLRAVSRALRLLHKLARRQSTFAEYGGHLLVAFYFIATTSGNAAIRQQALQMGRERARYWKNRWQCLPPALGADVVLDELLASYAVEQMGIRHSRIRRELQIAVARYTPRELLSFDPALEIAPADVPEDCASGHINERGRLRCRVCRKRLQPRSRYEVWYCALSSTYFCERYGIQLGARFVDVLNQLPRLRPYPKPGTPLYRDSIYAVTHIVYTLNDYGRSRLSPQLLPYEFRFLKTSMNWALDQQEPDTVGEIIDSLAGFGVEDTDPLLVKGRTFLLESQRADGGWGDEDDEYGRFHSVWTAIDGLRDYSWRENGVSNPQIRRALRRLRVST